MRRSDEGPKGQLLEAGLGSAGSTSMRSGVMCNGGKARDHWLRETAKIRTLLHLHHNCSLVLRVRAGWHGPMSMIGTWSMGTIKPTAFSGEQYIIVVPIPSHSSVVPSLTCLRIDILSERVVEGPSRTACQHNVPSRRIE